VGLCQRCTASGDPDHVCTATFMLLLDITVVNVALPSIQSSLHASFSDLQWVVDAYSLTLAAFLLTAGVVVTCSDAARCRGRLGCFRFPRWCAVSRPTRSC